MSDMASGQEPPPFLRLPGEIRHQIYEYLLSTQYTKHYTEEEDPDWEFKWKSPKNGQHRPTHMYRFQIGILRTNRQINCEASNVLYDQNKFVKMTSNLTYLDIDLDRFGVPIVAQSATASRFVHNVLHIHLKHPQYAYYEQVPRVQVILAGEDLPALCMALLLSVNFGSLSIDLDCNKSAERSQNHSSFSQAQCRSLLEPLRLLHSFHFAEILGPLDEKYKAELCRSICREAPSFQESLSEVLKTVQKGDKTFNARVTAGHRRQAIEIYSTAMTDLKNRCSKFDGTIQMLLAMYGTVAAAHVNIHIAYNDLVFKLRVNLATSHYELGQYLQSSKWSDRAVEDWNRLSIHSGADPRYLYARLLNARSNRKLGRWEDAIYSMEEAARIAPHLEQELEQFKGDEERCKERQLETVRRVQTNEKNRNGRVSVLDSD